MVKNTTIVIDDQIWLRAKQKCLARGITIRDYIRNLIVNDLEKTDAKAVSHKGVT
jgi:hypothetical protein